VNVVVFGFMTPLLWEGKLGVFEEYFLDGYNIKGLFCHMWLHAGPLHIIGNMLFLWVFGNAVCSKIGNLLYLPVYILLGLAAAVAFVVLSDGKALGASGAVNGIVGMYLVFFPLNDVTCFWMIYLRYSGTFSLSSFWMILFWFAFDIYGAFAGGIGVAYTAHIGGFLAGVFLAVLFLRLRIVVMEDDERSLLQVFSGKNSRQDEEDRLWEMRHNSSHLHQELYRAEEEFNNKESGKDYEQEYQQHQQKQHLIDVKPAGHQQRFAYQRQNNEDDCDRVGLVDDGYIRFACQCGKKLKMPNSYAGKNGKCPKCGSRVRVPR